MLPSPHHHPIPALPPPRPLVVNGTGGTRWGGDAECCALFLQAVLLPFLLLPWSMVQGLNLQHGPALPGAPWHEGGWDNEGSSGVMLGLPGARRGHGSRDGSQLDGTTQAAAVKSSKARKVSLSLDVPTHILRILLDLAREKELQARAAANAELMARIGEKK
uniref:Corticotropin-releasing factor domain-containing protein n=1 Tax=Coturnix japonica TaxID=93934 RepID=A0A8C2TQP6_COTJA